MRVSRTWNDLTARKRAGFGHDSSLSKAPRPGSLAISCPACPQPGINLPENWQEEKDAKWKYGRVITMDGNFKADHLNMDSTKDVFLSDGLAYFVGREKYHSHLESSSSNSEVSSHLCDLVYLTYRLYTAIPLQQP